MRTAFLLISCLCIISNAKSQDSSVKGRINGGKYAVTVAPTFFPFDKAGLAAGFQFGMNNRLALLTEVGLPLTKGSEKDQVYQNIQMVKFTTELKYYPKGRAADGFFSLQAGYLQRTFTDQDSGEYHVPRAANVVGYSRLTIKSPVYFVAVKWGSEAVEYKRVFLDCFLGIGVRIVPTKYYPGGAYDLGPWSSPRDNIGWMMPTPAWEFNKTCIRPHFTVGFRVGGRF